MSGLFEPCFEDFERAHSEGRAQVVYARLVADLETPVSAFLKLAYEQPNSFLLESVEGGAIRGRYSIIGLKPDLLWRCKERRAESNSAPEQGGEFTPLKDTPLDGLRNLLAASHIDLPESLPPMAAGVFGYMGYDTVRLIEDLPADKSDPIGVPDGLLMRPTLIVIFDNVKDEITVVTPVRVAAGGAQKHSAQSAKKAHQSAIDRIQHVIDKLDAPLPPMADINPLDLTDPNRQSNTSEQDYLAMVKKAKDYIRAGDIFQVVLSQRFSSPFDLPSFSLYRALRRINPSPFLYYLNFDGFAVVGSSPEILVRVRDNQVTIRPIAGTRPRGATKAEDKALGDDLLSDPKELAEHLMLLDLGRNDVGRVAKIGSVEVTDSYFLEYYSQVMHIVSNVIGELSGDHDAIDALMSGFPAGTVSGAPKVRAMQIIDELEKDKRGIYAGCVGYFSASGEMDTCIVLRTSVIKDGVMHVQAGAGIVADSDPKSEQQECINKASALFRAAEEAVRFASRGKKGQ